jgi:hypothetical protein
MLTYFLSKILPYHSGIAQIKNKSRQFPQESISDAGS